MNKILIIVICCLLFVVCCLAGGYFFIEKEIKKPYKVQGEEKIFEIEEGEGIKDIARNLEKEGLVKSDLYFLLYILKEGKKGNLKSGKYCLSPIQNIPELANKMINGTPIREEIKLTFPEGWRISKMEERLKSVGLIKDDEISKLRAKDFKPDYNFLVDVQDEASLEGYLFPDTYFFHCYEPEIVCEGGEGKIIKCQPTAKIEDILNKFLSNFDEKLTSDLREKIKKQNKTIFEIVIMASILEREVQTKEDKKIVSGIFWKRIKDKRFLESCATVSYILEEDKWVFSREEIEKAKSPYNTYLSLGLPPGPISNPGLESIEAAIYPKESQYKYFLTDPETKKTIFAKTFEEHTQNKTKYFNR